MNSREVTEKRRKEPGTEMAYPEMPPYQKGFLVPVHNLMTDPGNPRETKGPDN